MGYSRLGEISCDHRCLL